MPTGIPTGRTIPERQKMKSWQARRRRRNQPSSEADYLAFRQVYDAPAEVEKRASKKKPYAKEDTPHRWHAAHIVGHRERGLVRSACDDLVDHMLISDKPYEIDCAYCARAKNNWAGRAQYPYADIEDVMRSLAAYATDGVPRSADVDSLIRARQLAVQAGDDLQMMEVLCYVQGLIPARPRTETIKDCEPLSWQPYAEDVGDVQILDDCDSLSPLFFETP